MKINRVVKRIKQQIANGNWEGAAQSWTDLIKVIEAYSNFVVRFQFSIYISFRIQKQKY